jgi:transposase InsO family protein
MQFQSRFKEFVTTELGWKHHHIHKSSPNENAVIERSFRTDEEEFFWRMDTAALDIDDLNEQYQDYLYYYNNERIHLGIDLQTPIQKLQTARS